MIPYVTYKTNNIFLKILMFIPNLLLIIGVFLVNLIISIYKYICKVLTKEYKNEIAYQSFISLLIGLLFMVLVINDKKDYNYMFLDDLPIIVKIIFMSLFYLFFIVGVIMYFILRNKKKRFWLIRTISYILTFILIFVCLCFVIHYLRDDQSVFEALMEGSLYTVILFIVTLLFGLPLGLALAFGSMSKHELIKKPVKTLIWVIRGTPLMVQLAIGFYGLNSIGIKIGAFPAAVMVFALNSMFSTNDPTKVVQKSYSLLVVDEDHSEVSEMLIDFLRSKHTLKKEAIPMTRSKTCFTIRV